MKENEIKTCSSGIFLLGNKGLKRIFSEGSTYPLPRNTLILSFLLTLLMLVLAIVFYAYSNMAIDEHEDNTNIIDGVGQRLAYAISCWQLITRLYLSRIGLGNDNVATIRENISQEALNLLHTNNEVNDELSLILDGDRLADVFQSDIYLWEPYEGQTTTYHPINTFQATHILYDNLNEIVSQGASDLDDIQIDDLVYAMNNTANDYFLSSESLYSTTHNLLESLLDTNILNLQLILAGMSIVLVVFGVSLLVVFYLIIQAYRRLFRALMKIEEYHINYITGQLKKLQIYLEVDIENSKFGLELSGTTAETGLSLKDHKNKSKKRVGFSTREDRFTVRVLAVYLIKFVLFSLIFIAIPAILFYAALTDSIGDFGDLDVLDDQITVAAKAQYQVNLIMTVFYMDMMFRNDTSILIRDQVPNVQLSLALEELVTLHEELSQTFFSQGDVLDDPKIVMLLQENVCPLLENPTAQLEEYCLIATEGGELGLFSLNLGYISLTRTYITNWLETPTEDTADSLVEPYSDAVREIMETLEASYDFLNDYLLGISVDKVNVFKQRQDIFFAAILISIVGSFTIVYFCSIKKYRYVDMGRGKILKMIPYNVIQDNRALEFYLNKDFSAKKYNIGGKY